jgi:hypothetical protein
MRRTNVTPSSMRAHNRPRSVFAKSIWSTILCRVARLSSHLIIDFSSADSSASLRLARQVWPYGGPTETFF